MSKRNLLNVIQQKLWDSADSDTVESLRQQLAELKGMREEVVHYQKEFHRTRDQLSDHLKREVMLRDALRHLWNERTPDSLDEAGESLAATADLSGLILCHAELCRDDGRCQYAIDHGAEGLGHCPDGKCCMPLYRAWEPKT